MSNSMMLIHGASTLPFGDCRKRETRKVVCCCPWSRLPDEATKHQQKIQLKSSAKKLPPSPSMLQLIGTLHYFIRSFPYHYPLSDLAKTCGPLMHIKVGHLSAIVVSSAHHAEQLLKTHDLACANRPNTEATQVLAYNCTNIVCSPYGEYWRQMRSICISEMLSPKMVRSFEYIRKDEASALIKSIQSNSGVPFDLSKAISLFVYSATARAVCGRSMPMDDDGMAMVKESALLATHILPADVIPSFKQVFNLMSWDKFRMMKLKMELGKFAENIIEEHRKKRNNGNGDLVDALLQLQESSHQQSAAFSITNDNIKAVILDIIFGGTDSSTSLVDWAMAELMKHPHVMSKVQDEIRQAFSERKTISEFEIKRLKYLKLVIKETLRLHPPFCIIPRACREAFEIDGYHIPLNSYILVNNWWIGRDPKYWSNPDSFEPERFEEKPIDFFGNNFEYIPFGSGKRICPGISFGLSSAEYLLVQLLYNFDWKLPQGISPNDIDMTEAEGVAVSRKNSLYLVPTPHVPSDDIARQG